MITLFSDAEQKVARFSFLLRRMKLRWKIREELTSSPGPGRSARDPPHRPSGEVADIRGSCFMILIENLSDML